MSETTSSGLDEKAQSRVGDTASAARDMAGRTAATTGQTLSQGMDSAMDSMQQIRRKLEDATQGLPSAPTSSRLAWRAGRWLGRVEGVIWLGSKGAGIWWGRTKKRLQHQPPDERARMLVQWGPSVIATGWLSVQAWNRLRGSGMKKRGGS
ncbi:MAG: hypothetical protein ACXVA4_09845 [Ktedonobacterales bacterium]